MKEFDEIIDLLSENNIFISDQYPAYVPGDYETQSLKIPHIEMGEVSLGSYSLSNYKHKLFQCIENFISILKKEKFYHGEYPIVLSNIKKLLKRYLSEISVKLVDQFIMTYSKPVDLSKINEPLDGLEVKKIKITQDKLKPDALNEIYDFIGIKVWLCEKLIIELDKLSGNKHQKKKTINTHSFNYNGSFDNLKLFYDRLLEPQDNGGAFISKIEYMEFRKVFTNKEVTTRINWLGQHNELHLFIDVLSESKWFDKISQKWSLARKCFLYHNEPINIRHLKDADDNPKRRSNELKNIVDLLP